MKKMILPLVLILISMQAPLYAQTTTTDFYKQVRKRSRTESTFNINYMPNIGDYVYLKNGKMIVEAHRPPDYQGLSNIDSILMQLQTDIAFYKDSLENGTGNVRIDYTIKHDRNYRQIRIKKYKPDGDAYIALNDETERLKIEQDTVRLIIDVPYKTNYRPKKAPVGYYYPVQVTFILNNYADVAKIIGEKDVIRHAIDTLSSVRTKKENKAPFKFPSSCIYRPYANELSDSLMKQYNRVIHFVKFNQLLKEEYGQFKLYQYPDRKFVAYGNISGGLVRNTLAPGADLGFSIITPGRRGEIREYEFSTFYLSSLFFFEKNAAGDYLTRDNWFVNFESGSTYDADMLGVKVNGISLGAGYLVRQSGDYFRKATFRVFMGVRLRSGISMYPELIATNSFKQVFPGITMKIFGFKREEQ